MRIISKFRDYYDSVQAHGVDLTLVFKRQTQRLLVEDLKKRNSLRVLYSKIQGEDFDGFIPSDAPGLPTFTGPLTDRARWMSAVAGGTRRYEYHLREFVVGFCGYIRTGLHVLHGPIPYLSPRLSFPDAINDFVYCVEEMDKVVSAFPKALQELYHGGQKSRKARKRKVDLDGTIYHLDRDEVVQFFKVYALEKDDRLFTHLRAPILTYRRVDDPYSRTYALHINDELNKTGFYRVVDPYLAYQEIAQYISGVLGVGEPETLEISDEDMRDEKGFFDMSFKKDPGVKKPRRRGKKK